MPTYTLRLASDRLAPDCGKAAFVHALRCVTGMGLKEAVDAAKVLEHGAAVTIETHPDGASVTELSRWCMVELCRPDETQPIRPGALIRSKDGMCYGVILRWPQDRPDWKPLNDGSDEWVVLWLNGAADGQKTSYHAELCCAGEFDVVGHLPTDFC